jgi:hypothetical protein
VTVAPAPGDIDRSARIGAGGGAAGCAFAALA